MSLYRDIIIDHYQNPRHQGELKHPDGKAKEANASCGDMIEFQVKIKRLTLNDSRLTNIKWRSVGCAISTAAASLLSEQVISDKSEVKSVFQMTDRDMVKLLGGEISSARIKCATLPLKALQRALKAIRANYD